MGVTNPPYSNDGYHLSLSLSQRNPGQLMDDEEVHQGNVDHNVRLLPRLDRDGDRNHLRHRGPRLGLPAPGAWTPQLPQLPRLQQQLQRLLRLRTRNDVRYRHPNLLRLHRNVHFLPRSMEDDRQQEYDWNEDPHQDRMLHYRRV